MLTTVTPYSTSNVTGRHWGLKRKLRAGAACALRSTFLQHCSSIYACMYRLLAGTRCKLAQWVLEPWPKTNLVHSRAVRKPLVAIILSTLKCMFYSRTI